MNEYSFIYQRRKPAVKPKTGSLASQGRQDINILLKQNDEWVSGDGRPWAFSGGSTVGQPYELEFSLTDMAVKRDAIIFAYDKTQIHVDKRFLINNNRWEGFSVYRGHDHLDRLASSIESR